MAKPMFKDDQKVRLLVKENPKAGASRKRFAKYRSGLTVKAALAKGITRGDLRWDTDRRFIAIA